MGIIDRYLERRGFIRNDSPAMLQKSAGFMELETAQYPDGRVEPDKNVGFRDFIDAYSRLPWMYAAATAVAIASMKATLKIKRETRKKDGEVEKTEILGEGINALLQRPNQFLSYLELLWTTVINMIVTGNQPWNLVGTKEKEPISPTNPPVEIWWIKPEAIVPKAGPHGELVKYVFTGPTGKDFDLDPSEIIHFRIPNPDSYFLGLGMVAPAKIAATLEFNAQAYNRAFLENDGKPPLYFEHPGEPDENWRKRFWAAWDMRHKGPKKAGRAGMVWGGIKVHELGTSPKDAQYIEMRKMNREEILACMGVPPSIVGLLEYANYSNMEIQQRKFWEDTVIPILTLIADKLTLNLGPHFGEGIVFEFDYSGVKALQENEEGKARTASILIANGLKTPNQLIRELYNGEGYVGGDQYYMSMSLIPVGSGVPKRARKRLAEAIVQSEVAKMALSEPPPEAKTSFWRANEARAKAYWESFEKRVSAKERAMAPEVEKFLRRQADKVKEKASHYHYLADMKIGRLFDVEEEVKSYAKKFEGRYREAFKHAAAAGLHATKGELYDLSDARMVKTGDDYQVSPEQLEELKRQIERAAKYFNETTWNVIKDDLLKAEAESWPAEELTQRLWEHLQELAPAEARRIARTEMGRTENWGQTEGYKENEYVNYKGWMCSFVPESRDAHKQADGQEVPLDEEFIVDGERLDYPNDSDGSAENVINCLCTTYPVVKEIAE